MHGKRAPWFWSCPRVLWSLFLGPVYACWDFSYPVKFLNTTNSLRNSTCVSLEKTRLVELIFFLPHVKLPDIGTILLVLASKKL